MNSIKLDISRALYYAEKQYEGNEAAAREAITKLDEGTGAGSDL